MMTIILTYLTLLFCFLFLPDALWESCFKRARQMLIFIKRLEIKNPFFNAQNQGNLLLNNFPELETKIALGIKTTSLILPHYKFYATLILKLLDIHRRLGISLRLIIPELRHNLIKDLQFEKKIKGSIVGGNLQFAVVTFTTWAFIFLSSSLADLPLVMTQMMVIFLLQILGVMLFNYSLTCLKKRLFDKFDESIERLYLFTGLAEIGLPIAQVLAESNILAGQLMSHKLFKPSAARLVTLVHRWKEQGVSPKNEVKEITSEMWHLKEMSFEQFLKHLDLLKFIVLAFFFLPAYFFYLYGIFQFFMEQ